MKKGAYSSLFALVIFAVINVGAHAAEADKWIANQILSPKHLDECTNEECQLGEIQGPDRTWLDRIDFCASYRCDLPGVGNEPSWNREKPSILPDRGPEDLTEPLIPNITS